ncbi:hypothetical protein [Micromonospora mirobrigensis]|uniref:Uncharacterized protein n=1 Tax=Micromonospora mirobrigensis TaxID=262898 RepID=A0A1C4X0Q5_9ACTN|nr:hypothetical protein [Micromonospora mirobrigensis]SCF01681.1 hypothetical protein GA0070564_102616 [Micromonospora mirobrigensis]
MSPSSRIRALVGSAPAGLPVATAPSTAAARAPDPAAPAAHAAVPQARSGHPAKPDPGERAATHAKLRPPSAPAAPEAARTATRTNPSATLKP